MTPAPHSDVSPFLLANDESAVGVPAAVAVLQSGGSALDAVEVGIRAVEKDPTVRTVGVGGAPNLRGKIELDASIMDGVSLQTGAVAALKGFLHPISVARQVMAKLPHVLVAGEGAARFADEIGAERGETLSPQAQADYEQWLARHFPSGDRPDLPLSSLAWVSSRPLAPGGTTVFLARDGGGRMAGGVSTSGLAYKYPGRVGDSPIIGAGLYVDGRYGAAACTHTGEMTIRAGTARVVVAYLKKGATVEEACREAAGDLRHLQGGLLGPVVIHALDRAAHPFVLAFDLPEAGYWWWDGAFAAPELRQAVRASRA